MIRLIDLLREDIVEANSVIDNIKTSLPLIKLLGDKTVLTRTFSGIRSGAAKVTTTLPKRQSADPAIVNVFDTLMEKLDFTTLVYCSHGNRKFIRGDQYIMVPGKNYKLAWSPKVHDLLVVASDYKKSDKINEFPYDSYITTWPKGDVSEVLVDCEEYYLITTRVPIVQDYMRKQKMGAWNGRQFIPDVIKTYNQLHDVLTGTLQSIKAPLSN